MPNNGVEPVHIVPSTRIGLAGCSRLTLSVQVLRMSPEVAKQLLAGEFGRRLLQSAGAFSLPIFWTARDGVGDWKIKHNGTAFLLDCGQGPFVVTAAHVYEGYLQDLEKQRVLCWLSTLPFPLEKKVICHLGHRVIDIATFRIDSSHVDEIQECGKRVLVAHECWPPRNVKEGDGVVFAGFPGHERLELGELECEFGLYSALTLVSSSSARHFGCAFDRSEWIDTMGNGLPEEGFDLGGISGCPVLALKKVDPPGDWSLSLAGVAYNSSVGIGEILLVHHASAIRPDGQLNGI